MKKKELFLRNLITMLIIFGLNQEKKMLLSTTEDKNESDG